MSASGKNTKMRAVLYDKKNPPDYFVLRKVDKPVPAENEVLVKIVAASINAADYRSLKSGYIPKSKIFGADIAGRVEALGENCTEFKVGDEVFGDLSESGFGGFAEYVSAPENMLARKPAGVSFEDAAALPLAGVTALKALRDIGNVRQGQKVLIIGASGGVGTYAVQLAKFFGAEVTAVCSEENLQRVRSLGAAHVVDYTKEDFSRSGSKYDLVLVVNGNRPLSAFRRVMLPRGITVMVGGSISQLATVMLFGPLLSIGGKKMRFLSAKPNPTDLDFLVKLVEEGRISAVIDRRFLLKKTPEAMRYVSQGHARGKVIINVEKA